jgi:hypothetical protein
MSSFVLTNSKLWLAQFDLSGDLSQMALKSGADAKDATTFGQTTRVRKGGLRSVMMQHEGFVNTGTNLADEVLFNRIGTGLLPATISPTGGVEGDPAYSFLSELSRYEPGAEVGEMLAFSVEGEAQSDLVSGKIMHNATRIGSGFGTAFQLGAVPVGKRLFAALHVVAASGPTPLLSVTVQSDNASGFPSTTIVGTFGAKTTTAFEWLTPIAGPITDDWWRVVWTITGTSPSFTFIAFVGIL